MGTTDSDLTGRLGVNLVEAFVLGELGWVFREQSASDEGVDAQAETKEGGLTTGRLLALQIKAGPSYFAEPKGDGWVFRFGERQARLWLGHALPVILILVDVERREAYWQRFSTDNVVSTGKAYKVHVPRSNTVRSAGAQWNIFASGIESRALDRFEVALKVIPPAAAERLVEMSKADKSNAAILAMHLADGRRNPGSTTEALLLARPHWLETPDGLGYRTLASYAAAHEHLSLSSQAFEIAAEKDSVRRGKLLAAASLNAFPVDPARSRLLLEQARAFPEAQLLIRLADALFDHPHGDAGPRQVMPPFDLGSPEVLDNGAIQAFLADQALRGGELDAAVQHARRACELEPANADFMGVLADALGRRSFRASGSREDLEAAAQYLCGAVDQLHSWDGPSLRPLEGLLRVLALTGDHETTLRYSLSPPRGVARPEEAKEPFVLRHALIAAFQLSRDELLQEIADKLGDDPRDELDRALVGLNRLTTEQQVELWRKVATEASATSDYQELVAAVLHLGRLGVDEAAALKELVDRRVVPPGAMALAAALALARTNLEQALPELRALARTDISAAEHLMSLLSEAGRHREAAAAARTAHDVFRQDYFLLSEAQIYMDAELWEQAEIASERAVAVSGFPRERGRLLTFLAGRAADRGDWTGAEENLARVLPLNSEARSKDVWRLVGAQLHRAEARRAVRTIRTYKPLVETAEEATMWLQAMVVAPWDQDIASEALSLALRFEGSHEVSVALLWQVISRTTSAEPEPSTDLEEDPWKPDTRPVVTAELRQQAFAALDRHANREHPKEFMRKIEGSDDEVIEEMAAVLKKDHQRQEPLRALLAQVREGKVPIGLLAAGTGRSYALTLIQQVTGPLVAAASNDDEHELDRDAAIRALDGAVATEASALLLTSQLSGGARLRGHFSLLHLPASSRRDILRATVEIQGMAGSPGTLYWDVQTERPAIHELSMADFLRYQRRAEDLDAAAAETSIQVVTEYTILEELAGWDRDDSWLAPLQLAHEQSVALWSDDIGLRRLARTVGLSTFGTPALIEVLNDLEVARAEEHPRPEERIEDLIAERQEWVRQLVREFVVDVAATSEDLCAQAEVDDWQPNAAATALTRASWWAWQQSPYDDWGRLIALVALHNPAATRTWQYAAMLGVARAYLDKDYSAAMLAAVAMQGLGHGVTVEDTVDGLRRARKVANDEGMPDPLPHVPLVASALAKQSSIPDPESFATTVLSLVESPEATNDGK